MSPVSSIYPNNPYVNMSAMLQPPPGFAPPQLFSPAVYGGQVPNITYPVGVARQMMPSNLSQSYQPLQRHEPSYVPAPQGRRVMTYYAGSHMNRQA